jgi:hypothetical protein
MCHVQPSCRSREMTDVCCVDNPQPDLIGWPWWTAASRGQERYSKQDMRIFMHAMQAYDLGRAPPLQIYITSHTASRVELFPCDIPGHVFRPERRVVRRSRNGVWGACPLSPPCLVAVRRISRVSDGVTAFKMCMQASVVLDYGCLD